MRTWEREAAEAKTRPDAPEPEPVEVEEPEEPEEPEELEEPEPIERIPPPEPSPRSPRRDRGWKHRFIAGGLGGISAGSVPGVTGVLSGWAGYAYGPLRIELSGQHAFGTTGDISTGIGVRASASGGGASLLFTPRVAMLRGLVGTGIRAGALRGAGTGQRVASRDADDWWMSIPLIVGATWPADFWVALRGQAELWVGLRRPGIEIRAEDESLGGFRTAPVGFSVLLGPEFRLP